MKKTIYILLSTALGVLLSFILHAVIEVMFLNWAEANNLRPEWYSLLGKSCALPLSLNIGLLVAGVVFGIWIGFKWWKVVYVERKRGLFTKIKE
ncbi:MAG: hypothetical protein ABIB97_01665 [Patescibacteria group bacterium]